MNRGRRDRGRGHSRGGMPSHPTNDRRDPSARPSCQIYGKVGHIVVRYWYKWMSPI